MSDFLDKDGISQYMSMIGALQWCVSIGRIDIATAVMTMSSFRVAPRIGHLDRLKRIYGYISKMRHSTIRIRILEPDYSDIPDPQYDWASTVHDEYSEQVPDDAPTPLGKYVTLSHFVDANLLHDLTTGKSCCAVLHLMNQTPIDWYSKKLSCVETSTYSTEIVSARICMEQIIDLRTTLRYLGVPIREKSYMFGDNKSVVDSATKPQSKLHKRHQLLSFMKVRQYVASGMVSYNFVPGDLNPADMLSKAWGRYQIWPMLNALLFYKGDTAEIEN